MRGWPGGKPDDDGWEDRFSSRIGTGMVDEQPEDAVARRQVADPLRRGAVDAHVDELARVGRRR